MKEHSFLKYNKIGTLVWLYIKIMGLISMFIVYSQIFPHIDFFFFFLECSISRHHIKRFLLHFEILVLWHNLNVKLRLFMK